MIDNVGKLGLSPNDSRIRDNPSLKKPKYLKAAKTSKLIDRQITSNFFLSANKAEACIRFVSQKLLIVKRSSRDVKRQSQKE